MTQDDGKRTITAAVISGIFLLIAAVISGIFLIQSSRIKEDSISTATAIAQIHPNPLPTYTIFPTYTPQATTPIVVTAPPILQTVIVPQVVTATPPPTEPATPTPAAVVLFQDTFDPDKGIRPEWKKLSGDTSIVEGHLEAVLENTTMEIGDDSLSNYTVEFDYERDSHSIFVTVANKLRYDLGDAVWYALQSNGGGVLVGRGPYPPSSGHFRLTIKGSKYTIYANGQPLLEINYGEQLHGPFDISMGPGQWIDNFSITKP